MTDKLYWHGSKEFGWSACGSRSVGGNYWIVPTGKGRFQVRFQEKQSGNTHWFRRVSDVLDEAKAIAQTDNDARQRVTAERAKGSAP